MNKYPLKNFYLDFFHQLYYAAKNMGLNYSLKKYEKNQVIALRETECKQIGIITKGEARIEHLSSSGKRDIIRSLKRYDIFGEILIFTEDSHYPYDIISISKTEIFFINKENLLKILKENINLLENFLSHISSSYIILNKIIKLKSQKTIEHKLAYYFLYFENITENKLSCKIKSKTYLADLLGIERPSLHRALNNLQERDYLFFEKNHIIIKDLAFFKKLVE